MSSATKTPTLPAVAERERLRGVAEGHQAHRDRLDTETARVKARLRALRDEIGAAQLAVFNGDTEAEKLVKKLRAERAELRILYREERQGNAMIVSGDLMEERETLATAVRGVAKDLSALHVDHVEEFLANAAPMVAEAEQAATEAVAAVKAARVKWDAARAELNTIARDAGIGEAPEFPITVRGTTTLRPHRVPAPDLAKADVAIFQHSPGGAYETVLIDSPAFEDLERASAWKRVR